MNNQIAMLQNQNQAVADDKYIKDRPEDQLSVELDQMARENLTARKVRKLKKVQRNFINAFVSLAYSHYGLGLEQIKNLEQDKRIALANLLLTKSRPMATIIQPIIMFVFLCIPIIGWAIVADDYYFSSFFFLRSTRKLKSVCGEKDWFPHELLEDYRYMNYPNY